jgi:phosphoglucan,water dikinase
MTRRIRIGNQTAFSAATPLEPFEFALAHGFDAFEWFGDKKVHEDGTASGWDMGDMDDAMRKELRHLGKERDIRYSVHAPWQANPLWPEGNHRLLESLEFAVAIGAGIVNLHLYMDEGPEGYVHALQPVIRRAGELGLGISIENTPHTTPEDVNQTFTALRDLNGAAKQVGLCLDLGHANLCAPTRNDYIGYIDQLASDVPIIHLHVHENYGDADSHLTLFSGPAGDDDAGIRAFIRRLRRRRFSGAVILEQWPEPRDLLLQAERRLRPLLGRAGEKGHQEKHRPIAAKMPGPRSERPRRAAPRPVAIDPNAISDAFIAELVAAHQRHLSWRERLGWVGECLSQRDSPLSLAQLATIAAYLRFLGTGEVPCEEDGRHFRPNHHARAALGIEEALVTLECPDNAWIVRKILPWLPSYSDQFCRREPLTRIRDIAHRNDIPKELKRDIKHRLQNKLHRCAGPEDLKTSEEILARITQPGADYSREFVHQFEIFHQELCEFFNATGVEQQLSELRPSLDTADAERARAFLDLKAVSRPSLAEQGALLELLTVMREALIKYEDGAEGVTRQRLRLVDIGLEDYAFALTSELVNVLERLAVSEGWPDVLRALRCSVANVRLSRIDVQECAAIDSELARWSASFDPSSGFQLQRLLATLERAQRLGEGYSDRVVGLFADRVSLLGTALGVPQRAIEVFCEGDIRGNIVFQLSKLVDMARAALRTALDLPPWEALVAGEAFGRLVRADELSASAALGASQIILLKHADGDEEIPRHVAGVLLAHPIPHLSHLGVRARQARVPFATADARDQLDQFQALVNGWVKLRVGAEQLSLERAEERSLPAEGLSEPPVALSMATLTTELQSLSLTAAEPTTCGAKAAAAGRLVALAEESGLFRAPRGRVLPFGTMEGCLSLSPALEERYQRLQQALKEASSDEQPQRLGDLRALLAMAPIPDQVFSEIEDFFPADVRLAVRSSANGEDLEGFAGAGLYESVIGVGREGLAEAVRAVWASLWTRRAALSRMTCGISHEQVHMAVLIQEMVPADLSFIMHTADPITGSRDQASVEMAIGLGETLASAVQPGNPYRLLCNRQSAEARLTRLASFSFALLPGSPIPIRERIDYSRVPWSAEPTRAELLGARLIDIAAFLEARFGSPQDVEGVAANNTIYLVQSRPQQGLWSQEITDCRGCA